jgi:hypothetical protein
MASRPQGPAALRPKEFPAMRATRFALFSAATALAVGVTAVPAPAQENNWVPGKRFTESYDRVLKSIQRITDTTRYGYVDGICFLSAFLNRGEDTRFTREFKAGTKYSVVGGGDNGTVDLDLYILDEDGRVVVKDELTDNYPVVEFTPPRTGRYTIRMVMYDAGKNGGFGSVGILRQGGYEVPVRNQSAALANLVQQANNVDRQVSDRVYFNSGGGQWGVYGSIIPQGSELTVYNITPGGGRRVWVTGGDTTVTDVDLFLYDADGRELRKDEDLDARPLIDFRTRAGEQYSVRIKNVQSRGASLVLVATLSLVP